MDVEPEVGSLATQVAKRWQGDGERFYAMGGEAGVIRTGQITEARVFGQMESYDPAPTAGKVMRRCRLPAMPWIQQSWAIDLWGWRRSGDRRCCPIRRA
jgi:hypothetical protein